MDPFTVASSQLDALMHKLTPRQLEIVQLLAQGHGISATATILSISRETVKTHILRMCHKLDAENRIQLIVMYAVWKARENS